MCDNLHILLCEKANDWYWRCHKRTRVVVWNELCYALRSQFQDTRLESDIIDSMCERKQMPGESFDNFCDSITKTSDKLVMPMSETELLNIIKRNLRPEVRKDLLYVQSVSVEHLRSICRQRKSFYRELHARP